MAQNFLGSNDKNFAKKFGLFYLSVVVPLFNEKENVEILYDEIRDAVDVLKKPYEIIFIDDGSSDKTIERLKDIKNKEKRQIQIFAKTQIIKFARNFGQTTAMQAGFDYANGEIIVSMDGDLQNDPADIPKLIEKVNQGYDVVCGWRKDRKDKTFTRILPSKVANWMIGKITGVSIHDNGCSLKAYRAELVKSVRLYSDMHRFIPAVTTMAGARITELVVNHRPRKFGKTKYGLSRIWKVLFDIVTIKMLIHFYNQPVLWFALLGLIFAVFGFGFGLISIITYFQGIGSIVFPSVSFLFFSLFGSFVLWGFLAEFLIRVEGKALYREILAEIK